MKRFVAAAFAIIACSFLCSAQQIDPSHNGSAATFGNQRSPKKEKAASTRTVSGQVTDASGQVLEGALVTLTNKKTNEKTNFFTKKDGRYQFADLSFTEDYEVQARYKDKQSELRKLSQYDATPRPVRILEIPVNAAKPSTSARTQPQP